MALTLSAAIMAHPVRRESAEAIQAALDRPVPIIYDEVPTPSKDPLQRWNTGRRAWEAGLDADADWHLVLQDDIETATNLLTGLEQAINVVGPDGLITPYTGSKINHSSIIQTDIRRATNLGSPWFATRRLIWGPAILAPTHTIQAMLEYGDQKIHRVKDGHRNYDTLVGDYYRLIKKWPTLRTNPSLVQHPDEMPSLIGHGKKGRRNAHTYTPGIDATTIPWRNVGAGIPRTL